MREGSTCGATDKASEVDTDGEFMFIFEIPNCAVAMFDWTNCAVAFDGTDSTPWLLLLRFDEFASFIVEPSKLCNGPDSFDGDEVILTCCYNCQIKLVTK